MFPLRFTLTVLTRDDGAPPILVPRIKIPIKDCSYKGEHPNLRFSIDCSLGFGQALQGRQG